MLHLPVETDFISYQPVVKLENSIQYLRAINVLSEGKVIDKINYSRPYQEYDKLDARRLVKKYFLDKLKSKITDSPKKSKVSKAKYRKSQNNEARIKASESLLTNMGL